MSSFTGTTATKPKKASHGSTVEGSGSLPTMAFTEAAVRTTRPGQYDQTRTLTDSTQSLPLMELPTLAGYLTSVIIRVDIEGSAGGVFGDDGAAAAIVAGLQDVNGTDIFAAAPGDEIDLVNLTGGWASQGFEPILDPEGTTVLWFRLPVEVTPEDGFGSLANTSSASTFRVPLALAPVGKVFSTLPADPVTVRVRSFIEGWYRPKDVIAGHPVQTAPPAHGAVMKHTRDVWDVRSGEQNRRLSRVGWYVRTILLIARDAGTGARTDEIWPERWTFKQNDAVIRQWSDDYWRQVMAQQLGLSLADLPVGLRFFSWCADTGDGRVGFETKRQYLTTSAPDNLSLLAEDFTGSGNVVIITQDIAFQSATAAGGQ